MNNWIIYKHTFPNGKHYIGKTSQTPEDRWGKNGNRYQKQKLIWHAIQKYGWDNVTHEILYTNLSEEEANNKEIECIKKYHSHCKDPEGPGYNISKGGEGFLIIDESKRQEIIKEWNEGKTVKEIREMSDISKESIKKILTKASIPRGERVQRGAEKYNSTQVYQYDLKGNFINKFPSIQEASRQTKVPQQNISKCITGKRHTAGNYQWTDKKEDKLPPALIGPGFKKQVYQYDLNYNLINIYPSAAEASKQNGYDVTLIRTQSKKQGKAYGYIWSYEEIVK
jgi:group I intron endonuclease